MALNGKKNRNAGIAMTGSLFIRERVGGKYVRGWQFCSRIYVCAPPVKKKKRKKREGVGSPTICMYVYIYMDVWMYVCTIQP